MIIPIFIPHKGCPHDCIFCNQKSISGQVKEVSIGDVKTIIDTYLGFAKNCDSIIDVAFYGGSFTGLDIDLQQKYLSVVKNYIDNKVVRCIRLSTRPDYITDEIVNMLNKNGVKLVELGVQSMDDNVLKLSNRGHNESDVYNAVKVLSEAGMDFGIQTMIGLLGDTRETDLNTATKVIAMNPKTLRIYPTLVIKGTYLEKMYNACEYKPLELEEAISITAKLLEMYYENGINVIRVGLQPTNTVRDGCDIIAGPFHPAFRQLVESRMFRNKMEESIILKGLYKYNKIFIYTNRRCMANVVGNKRANIKYFKDKYGFSNIVVREKYIEKVFSIFADDEFCF
jgi:histone acetyltransferase (RNA polymerase elongator complex component)